MFKPSSVAGFPGSLVPRLQNNMVSVLTVCMLLYLLDRWHAPLRRDNGQRRLVRIWRCLQQTSQGLNYFFTLEKTENGVASLSNFFWLFIFPGIPHTNIRGFLWNFHVDGKICLLLTYIVLVVLIDFESGIFLEKPLNANRHLCTIAADLTEVSLVCGLKE